MYADKDVTRQVHLKSGPGFVGNTDNRLDPPDGPWHGHPKTTSTLMSRGAGYELLSFITPDHQENITVMPANSRKLDSRVTIFTTEGFSSEDHNLSSAAIIIGAAWGKEAIMVSPEDIFYDGLQRKIRTEQPFQFCSALSAGKDTWPSVTKFAVVGINPDSFRGHTAVREIVRKGCVIVSSMTVKKENCEGSGGSNRELFLRPKISN